MCIRDRPKAGFLGGNDVPTNSSAGIYENDGVDEPVFIFPEPKVDVEIGSITVTAPDKDVYLLQNIPAADLQNGTASVGDVVLDLSRACLLYTSLDGEEVGRWIGDAGWTEQALGKTPVLLENRRGYEQMRLEDLI